MTATLAIRPWPDPVIDTLGHDPRSLYVERFWLPTLGPTSVPNEPTGRSHGANDDPTRWTTPDTHELHP